tara:strand:+ start:1486 stop:1701 length:216 start_codon:yes stop_codon:yes gene_type:complete
MEGFFNNMNPSVITSVLSRMNQQEFEECMEFIKSKALELPEGNKRRMYVRLFAWCLARHSKTFTKKEPSLF